MSWRRVLLVLSVWLSSPWAQAAEPFLLYQHGRLLNESDQPLSGQRRMQVRLWSSATESSPVWSENYEVTVDQTGLYSIAIGDTTGGKSPLLADHLSGERWLSVTIDDIELLPRRRLGVVPQALRAIDSERLAGRSAADYLQKSEFESFKSAVTVTDSGVTTIPWAVLSGIPATLAEVSAAGALAGKGTESDPLRISNGALSGEYLANNAVTREKLAPCGEGQILKFVSGAWTCGSDIGAGSTLPFEVASPLEQVSAGSTARLQLKAKGIDRAHLADDSIDSQKLGADASSLAKITGNTLSVTGDGALGVGVVSPSARLELPAFPQAGRPGVGSVSYLSGSRKVNLSGGTFPSLVKAGDSIQLGSLGWQTVSSVDSVTELTLAASFSTSYSGSWSVRRATLRAGDLVHTATGELGVGVAAPNAKVDVNGNVNVSGTVTVNGVNALVPPGAVMHFATPNCPEGWLKAAGQTLNAAAYPALAAAFGATGSFTLPDLRGEFVRGVDDGRGVDSGRPLRSAQGQDFKSFSMQNSGGPTNSYDHGPVYFPKSGMSNSRLFGGAWSSPTGHINIQWDGSEVRPRNVALLACLKY